MKTQRTTILAALATTLLFAGAAQADELADIRGQKSLKVGIFEDLPPFSSAGPDMTLHGYDIDIANALGRALGVVTRLVPVTGQNRIAALQAHKVDVLLSLGYSKERAEVLDYTAAYAPYYLAVFAPQALPIRGPADLAGKSVGVNRGTLDDTQLTQAAPAGTDVHRFDSYNGVVSAFLAGQVQAIAVGNDVGATVIASKPANVPEQKFILLSNPDHAGVNKGETALRDALDAAIAGMRRDGSLSRISEQWLKKPLDPKDLEEPGG